MTLDTILTIAGSFPVPIHDKYHDNECVVLELHDHDDKRPAYLVDTNRDPISLEDYFLDRNESKMKFQMLMQADVPKNHHDLDWPSIFRTIYSRDVSRLDVMGYVAVEFAAHTDASLNDYMMEWATIPTVPYSNAAISGQTIHGAMTSLRERLIYALASHYKQMPDAGTFGDDDGRCTGYDADRLCEHAATNVVLANNYWIGPVLMERYDAALNELWGNEFTDVAHLIGGLAVYNLLTFPVVPLEIKSDAADHIVYDNFVKVA
jgi:hypothetical protein